jgi:hypothetical protein
MLTVCCFRWRPKPGYRSSYSPDTVNTLQRMVRRHLRLEHRFVCVTDDPAGLDPTIEVVPLWEDFAEVASPSGPKGPSCYRRLKLFDPCIEGVLGTRFVALDLDVVLTGDVTPIWDRPEDFVIWGNTTPGTPYNGSMLLMSAGARPQVWTSFDPVDSPRRTMQAGLYGSDQAWISYCLGPNEARWTKGDGVYSFRNDLRRRPRELPANARLVSFHGRCVPWSPEAVNLPWIREAYR